MKNIITKFNGKIVLLLLLMFTLASCKDFLNVQNKTQADDGTVWTSTANADLFLNNVYSSLSDWTRTETPEEAYSGNIIGKENMRDITVYNKGAYTASSSGSPSYWNQFPFIRKANLFIQRVTASTLPDSYKKTRIAEARFLRAWYYMLMWTHHGGVPIITDVLNLTEQGDAIFRARNTDAETEKFIADECAAAALDLPLTVSEKGRATKGAALTLKGWVELFNASPLKNTTNDPAKWALAAATNKQVIDLNLYKLFPDASTMFYQENNNNSEVIWDHQHLGGVGNLGSSSEQVHAVAFVKGVLNSTSSINPTQGIVDSYQMANGKDITDATSGYDPQNPYVGREQRFYNDIVYDGSTWLGDIMYSRFGVNSLNQTDVNAVSDADNTGYYLRKTLEPSNAIYTSNLSSANWVYYRLAEVYLSYAEAQNEAVGPDASVYDAINKVRARVALPNLPTGLTQTQMRAAVRHERRNELFYEEHYWYDLIRWKTAEVELNLATKAMRIDPGTGGKLVYSIINCALGARVFNAPKNYLWPVPQASIDKNSKLTQNPGY